MNGMNHKIKVNMKFPLLILWGAMIGLLANIYDWSIPITILISGVGAVILGILYDEYH